MSKKHQTIPNEPEEMPERIEGPEIKETDDPKIPEIPQEAPDEIPPEITPDENNGGEPVRPG